MIYDFLMFLVTILMILFGALVLRFAYLLLRLTFSGKSEMNVFWSPRLKGLKKEKETPND